MEGALDSKHDYLSLADLTAAIRLLTPFDYKRLKLYALRFAWTGWDADDLLQEALMRMLDGRRSCPVDLAILKALCGVMRSVASEASDSASNVPLLELVPSHGDEEAEKPAKTPEQLRNNFTPERILSGRDDLAEIRALFKADPPAEAVFEGMLAGFEGHELSEVSEISHTELPTIRKRISRRIGTTLLKGMAR